MDTLTSHLHVITQEHIDAIESYYPHVNINDITHITLSAGIIKFTYEERSYVCNFKGIKKPNKITTSGDIFSAQAEVVQSVLGVLGAHHVAQQKVNFTFLEEIHMTITEYFKNLDLSRLEDVRISQGHILFRYYKGIYMCPSKHMSQFKPGASLQHEVVKISDVIRQYYPDIQTSLIRDIIIDGGQIVFQYLGKPHSCPLKPPSTPPQYHEISLAKEVTHHASHETAHLKLVK